MPVGQAVNEVIAYVAKWAASVIAAGSGGALAAYGVFKNVGKKWLDQHFATKLKDLEHFHSKKLEELKHAHNQEIETLKHEINSLFSRVSKIHEKEFEILPKAWFMLNELRGVVALSLDLTMKWCPDFARLPEADFEDFLRGCRLSDRQKEVLRETKASERSGYFSEAMAGIYLDDAHEKLRLFKNYLIEYSIFMTDELREKFSAAHRSLSDATIKYSVGRRAKNWEMEEKGQQEMLQDSLEKMIGEVEDAVQARLHYHEA